MKSGQISHDVFYDLLHNSFGQISMNRTRSLLRKIKKSSRFPDTPYREQLLNITTIHASTFSVLVLGELS